MPERTMDRPGGRGQVATRRDSALWDKIASVPIGPRDAALSFGDRLARENGWSHDYTEAVIFEYRRFLYLVAIADGALTPSDQVDQAWHLHLSYTKSYWHVLCGEVLGFELHHDPTLGGEAERARYRRQYAQTLAFYREVFDEPPPAAIWPSVEQRFESPGAFMRIDTACNWVIKRPRLATLVLIVVAPLILVACSDGLGDTDIWFWLKLAFGIYVVYKIAQWFDSGRGGGGGGGTGCGGACGGGCGGS